MRGIDPRTSHMLSERSTIWATSPYKTVPAVQLVIQLIFTIAIIVNTIQTIAYFMYANHVLSAIIKCIRDHSFCKSIMLTQYNIVIIKEKNLLKKINFYLGFLDVWCINWVLIEWTQSPIHVQPLNFEWNCFWGQCCLSYELHDGFQWM